MIQPDMLTNGSSFVGEVPLILVAEDRDDDVLLIRKSLEKAQVTYPLQFVRDGEEAISYLKGEGKYANREEYPLPQLLLLDLKMPRRSGLEVLEWIRKQPGLHNLRVVMLTSSDEIRDVNTAYSLGANSFLVKPLDFNNFVQLGEFITKYWLRFDSAPEVSRLPRTRKPTQDG